MGEERSIGTRNEWIHVVDVDSKDAIVSPFSIWRTEEAR